MIPFDRYAEVFGPWSGKRAVYFRPIGNVGDRLIDVATFQLFAHYGIRITTSEHADVAFWAGGGNMGTLYPRAHARRLTGLSIARDRGIPFVVLPQTWNAPDAIECAEIFAREDTSLQFEPRAKRAPDLGLAFQVFFDLPERIYDEGWFFRADRERGPVVHRRNLGDPAKRASSPADYVRLAAKFRRIRTDRTHFAVAALVGGCEEVTLVGGGYHKNRSIWEADLRHLGCHFEEPEEP